MILIKAYTNSEWDVCTHYALQIDKNKIEEWMSAQQKIAQYFPEEEWRGCTFSYYTYIDGKFLNIDEDEHPHLFKEDIQHIDNQEFDEPEQVVGGEKINISKYGVIISAYGKHSSDEFFTDDIDLKELLKLIE